jgi:hypothetical protein
MSNVIQMHSTRAAKAKGVKVAAYLAARSLGLTQIQAEACMRRAGDLYRAGNRSAARVVADVRRESREMAEGGLCA